MKGLKTWSVALGATLLMLGLFCAQPAPSMAAGADKYPAKSIELICSMSAGGDSDFNARVLAKYLTKELKQSVVVTNITGAGSSVATDEFVNNTKNDGYRLYMNHSSLHSATGFGISEYSWKDMEPVCIFGRGTGEVITVHASFPANDLKGFIAEASKNPGKYKFGYNAGATSHYLGVKLAQAGAKLNMVTTGSAADRVVGLKGKHLDVIVAGIPNVIDYVKTGEFKILSNCASERAAAYPDIPTNIELGYDISFDPMYTLYAPKGTDQAIIAKIEAAVKKIVLENTEYHEEIKKAYSQVPYYLGPAETKKVLEKQLNDFMAIKDELRKGF